MNGCQICKKFIAIFLSLVGSSLVLVLNIPFILGATSVAMHITSDRYFYQTGIFIYLALALLASYYFGRCKISVNFFVGMLLIILTFFAYKDLDQIKAWKDYESVLSNSIGNYGYQHSMSTIYSNRGRIRLSRGDDVGAWTDFEMAIRLRPDLASAYNNRGLIKYQRLRDLNGALSDAQKAFELSPDNPSILYNLASLYVRIGQNEKALALLTKAIEISAHRSPEEMTNPLLYRSLRMEVNSILNNHQAVKVDADYLRDNK